ncbi:MAG: transposase [Cyanobacteria bacterium REEB459]|nr:transposase [Cyanobacteria bacterium REEB459]
MTTSTPTDAWASWDRRLIVGSEVDDAGEGPSTTRRSGEGEDLSTPGRSREGEDPSLTRRSGKGEGSSTPGRSGEGEGLSTTRRSGVGEDPSLTRRSGGGEDPSLTRRSWRKRLPHFDVPGLIQHITFHLADSLPRAAIEGMQQELAAIPEAERDGARRQRIQTLLDSGLGSCVLREAACAEIVQDSLLFGDGDRYHLLAWVVMPNHVHVLIEQIPGWPMAKVVQSWKRHTSRQIHRLTPGWSSCTRPDTECNSVIPTDAECNSVIPTDADYKSALPGAAIPPLWQRDYWDRFIRNDHHCLIAKRYIEENPVAAGLAASPEVWPWSSAHFKSSPHPSVRPQELPPL